MPTFRFHTWLPGHQIGFFPAEDSSAAEEAEDGLSLVVRLKGDQIDRLRRILLGTGLTRELRPTNPYEAFRLGCGTEAIVGYRSGKVVATGGTSADMLSRSVIQLRLGEPDQNEVTIGSDEAGKGEWLGPMVSGAVALSGINSRELLARGVMDSKLLSLSKVRDLARVVEENCLGCRTVSIPPNRFNELFGELKKEGRSLNHLLASAHAEAIKGLLGTIGTEGVSILIVIDEFDRMKMEESLKEIIGMKNVKIWQYPGAEEEVAVAAASILARAERERWIDMESGRLGRNLRSLSVAEALNDPNRGFFAKVSYLTKRASRSHTS